jgi:AraC family transcriptional regulator
MELKEDGTRKYGATDVLASSRTLAWRGLAADLRHHPAGELPSFKPHHLEIGIAVGCHAESVVTRKGEGVWQRTRVEPGIVWLCPAGVLEEDIQISEWHDVLHLYLPTERFTQHAELRGGADIHPESVRYLAGLHDELIRQVGWSLMAEMRAPTSTGQMRVESISLALTARLVERYVSGISPSGSVQTRHLLDERRLRRVLQFMAEHLEDEIDLNELASVSCLSPFHFNRMFANRMGVPPHRYLGLLRLERAKTLLALGRLSLAEIAFACCFYSQSNFSRAFRRSTGTSPLRYRRETT